MVKKHYVASPLDTRKSLVESLHDRLGLPWQQARRLVREGRVRVDGRPCFDSTRRLRHGQQVGVDVPPSGGREPLRKQPLPPAPSPKRKGGEKQGLHPLSLQGRGSGGGVGAGPI